MTIPIRQAWIVPFAVAVILPRWASGAEPTSANLPPAVIAYEELLALFPEDRQGFSNDSLRSAVADQPMTYALVLSAEAIRCRAAPTDEGGRRVRNAAQWLIDNRDLDGDGRPGWGLPQVKDAFSDGSVNPPDTPYTITTALVLGGLLDALSIPDFWTSTERDRIRRLAAQVSERWCREVWSEGYSGGYFWYSPQPEDDHYTVNVSAVFLGSLARLLHEHGDSLTTEQRTLFQDRCDDLARALIATATVIDDQPYWRYAPLPNRFGKKKPSDALHHAYTLWGIEWYRDAQGRVDLPWSRAGAIKSFDCFWREDQLHAWPQNDSPPGVTSIRPDPARLWGAGMMLACYAQWGAEDRAAKTYRQIHQAYGHWPQLRIRPQAAADTVYLRHAAHVLLGLALHAYPSEG